MTAGAKAIGSDWLFTAKERLDALHHDGFREFSRVDEAVAKVQHGKSCLYIKNYRTLRYRR
jgi:hypothetical protein